MESGDPLALGREYEYYDPIYLLPESGQEYWRARVKTPVAVKISAGVKTPVAIGAAG